eukprot:8204707-Pyramimonas_sp.AAC.1
MRLSVERLGWHMPSFTTLEDDMGVEVQVTLVSPALLKRLLRCAVMRCHERTYGGSLGLSRRACLDVPLAALASS